MSVHEAPGSGEHELGDQVPEQSGTALYRQILLYIHTRIADCGITVLVMLFHGEPRKGPTVGALVKP